MNWLSQEEIKRRAEISDEEALNVSIEHWEQKRDTLAKGKKIHNPPICGLCIRDEAFGNDNCDICPLWEENNDKMCCEEWRIFARSGNPTLANAQAMLNRLYLERGKRYAAGAAQPKKECKKEEPKELRHGDYGYCRSGGRRLLVEEQNGTKKYGWEQNMWSQPASCIMGTLDESGAVVLGNIFDDLKRNAEDLERFEVDGLKMFIAEQNGGTVIKLVAGHQPERTFTIAESQKIGQKALQMVAYAKRKAKKDC